MTERPILFSGPMVRAILDGHKTQTRRVVKPQPEPEWWPIHNYIAGNTDAVFMTEGAGGSRPQFRIKCPYQPGDVLWVRETWWPIGDFCYSSPNSARCETGIRYKADDALMWRQCGKEYRKSYQNPKRWKPSIHMPRWASRLTLEVTQVRVERVQDISEDDAKAEGAERSVAAWRAEYADDAGMHGQAQPTHKDGFCSLWDSINARRGFGWETNPFVWAITFKVRPCKQEATDGHETD